MTLKMSQPPVDPGYMRLAARLHPMYLWVRDSKPSRRLYAALCASVCSFIWHRHLRLIWSDVAFLWAAMGCCGAVCELAMKSTTAVLVRTSLFNIARAIGSGVQTWQAGRGDSE